MNLRAKLENWAREKNIFNIPRPLTILSFTPLAALAAAGAPESDSVLGPYSIPCNEAKYNQMKNII
jgi:hypothetical protein